MRRALVLQALRRSRVRIIAVTVAAFIWGVLGPVLYVSVLQQFTQRAGVPSLITHFGSGNLATLTGTITELYEHPFLIAMGAVIAAGMGSSAIAGARQRGTLEMWLSRPIGRRVFVTMAAVTLVISLLVMVIALVSGTYVGALLEGKSAGLDIASAPALVLNGVLLYAAFASFALAASASTDRAAPALAAAVTWLLLSYLLEVLAPLWSPLTPYQGLSLFHHFQPGDIFSGDLDLEDVAILAGATVVPFAYALWRFPRRDLAAPE